MNDEPDPRTDGGPDPVPDPVQDARLRAVLAELGSDPAHETMPTEVAARLEDTLARLVAERAGSGAGSASGAGSGEEAADVVPLRRRWVPRLAAAAAAVIVLGVGGLTAANLGLFESSGDSGASAGSTADRDTAAESAPQSGADLAALPRVGATSFAADVAALIERTPALVRPKQEAAREKPGGPQSAACPGPEVPRGATSTAIRLDDAPAVLLVHPERSGRRLVEAWTCDGSRTLAVTRLRP